MKLTRIFASMLILAATASASFASSGAVNINWNSCVGPVDVTAVPGTTMDALVSLFGFGGAGEVATGYQVVTIGGPASGLTRDAWRFDPAGCNVGQFTMVFGPTAALSKSCPAFHGVLAIVPITSYTYDGTTGKVQILAACAYPNGGLGNPAATNPAVHYALCDYSFNQIFGVAGPGDGGVTNCGGLDVPTCWVTTQASWLDLNNVEAQFAINSNFITTNDANNAEHCPGVVPSAARTWGSVKGQYRN